MSLPCVKLLCIDDPSEIMRPSGEEPPVLFKAVSSRWGHSADQDLHHVISQGVVMLTDRTHRYTRRISEHSAWHTFKNQRMFSPFLELCHGQKPYSFGKETLTRASFRRSPQRKWGHLRELKDRKGSQSYRHLELETRE